MNAVKLHVTIPEDRRLVITLPDSVPSGSAEVIVLTERPGSTADIALPPREFGCARGLLRMADDFDDTPPDFQEYLR